MVELRKENYMKFLNKKSDNNAAINIPNVKKFLLKYILTIVLFAFVIGILFSIDLGFSRFIQLI